MKPRLLVIELHHLGDAVLSLPFLQAARLSHEVTVFCTLSVADMLNQFLPQVQTVVAAAKWPARFLQAAGELKALRPAITVCAWSDTRSHLVAKLTGAPRRLGYPTTTANFYALHLPWRRRRRRVGQFCETLASTVGLPLLTEPLQRASSHELHLHNWQQIASGLGLELKLDRPWFEPRSVAPADRVTEFLTTEKARGLPLWILHCGGRLPTKRWPLERYQQVLEEHFARQDIPVLILQAPGELAPRAVGPHQMNHTTETHAELAHLLSQAEAFLGNDSYPAHLGAALRKKVFTIFGSGNPEWFAPYGNQDRVLRSPVCPVHPCVDRCVMPDYICLKGVQVAEVKSRLAEVPSSF